MIARFATVLALVVMWESELLAQQTAASTKVGDLLFVRMTGDLAKQYARSTGGLKDIEVPGGLEIETTATVAQQFGDGRVRIEHSRICKRKGNPDALITMTATVDSSALTADVTPKGTLVYSSPVAQKSGDRGTPTMRDSQNRRIELSELKGVKLRTWKLVEEVGD
jgi:hypothetical protein